MLVDQQHLVSIVAGQAVGAMDIKTVEHCRRIAQALQRGSDQGYTRHRRSDTPVPGEHHPGRGGLPGPRPGWRSSLRGRWDQKPERRWQRVRAAGLTPVLADRIRAPDSRIDGIVDRPGTALGDRQHLLVDVDHDALTQPGDLEAHPDPTDRFCAVPSAPLICTCPTGSQFSFNNVPAKPSRQGRWSKARSTVTLRSKGSFARLWVA